MDKLRGLVRELGRYFCYKRLTGGLVLSLTADNTSKMVKSTMNGMREVLSVEESLPVASCSGCGRSVFSASHWSDSVMSLAQENVTQDENVTFSASSALYFKCIVTKYRHILTSGMHAAKLKLPSSINSRALSSCSFKWQFESADKVITFILLCIHISSETLKVNLSLVCYIMQEITILRVNVV